MVGLKENVQGVSEVGLVSAYRGGTARRADSAEAGFRGIMDAVERSDKGVVTENPEPKRKADAPKAAVTAERADNRGAVVKSEKDGEGESDKTKVGGTAKEEAQEGAKVAEKPKAETKEKVKKTEEVTAEAVVEPKDETRQFVVAAAVVLGVEPEVVAEAMESLGLTVADLSENDNAVKLAQVVLGVESKAELLVTPEIGEKIKAVKAVAAAVVNGEEIDVDALAESFPKLAETIYKTAAANGEIEVSGGVKAEVAETGETVNAFVQTAAVKVNKVVEALGEDDGGEDAVEAETETAGGTVNVEGGEVVVKAQRQDAGRFEDGNSESEAQNGEADANTTPNPVANANVGARQTQTAGVAAARGEVTARGAGAARGSATVEAAEFNAAADGSRGRVEVGETVRAGNLPRINAQDVINQITERFKVDVRQDVATEIKIRLKPEHLGDVTMKITTQNGVVTAQFEVANRRVKEIIEASFNQLRDSLQERGVNVSSLEVNVGDGGDADGTTRGGNAPKFAANGSDGTVEAEAEEAEVDLSDGALVDYTV